jgi:hypothetical protein
MAFENITALDDDDDNCFSFYLLSPAVTELWTLYRFTQVCHSGSPTPFST